MNTSGLTLPELDERSNTPLYLQVEATLRELIEGVVYSPGDQIPSERELSDMLGISRMTARRAIENLIRKGILERRSTQGTFVRQPSVLRRVGKDFALGLTQLLHDTGATPGSRLLSFDVVPAPLKIAEKLNIRLGEPVAVLRRLRLSNGVPFCIETSYLPQKLVPGLCAEDFTLENSSLYSILRDRYKIFVSKNDETLKVSYATAEESSLLGLKTGSPIMLLRSVVQDMNEVRVEYLKSVNHPDRVVFHSTATVMPL